jgi:class 3 adenylate cyclase
VTGTLTIGSPGLPLHRSILAVDIEGSTTRANPVKAALREVMYDLVERAMRENGIGAQYCDPLVDRGDGILALIHPVDQVPKTALLNAFVPALSQLLADHNGLRPDHRIRLRAAVHAGEVHYDRMGPFGEAIDITCRLLDAPEVKVTLRRTAAPLVLVVSDDIYRSVIRHGYHGLDDQAFEPLVRLRIHGYPQCGWVRVPPVPVVTGDRLVDTMLHHAGQELDARAMVQLLEPAEVAEEIMRSV